MRWLIVGSLYAGLGVALADTPVGLALDPRVTLPTRSTVDVPTLAHSVIDTHAGTATFDWGTSRFTIRVVPSGLDTEVTAKLVRADLGSRGIELRGARFEAIDDAIVVTPVLPGRGDRESQRLLVAAYIPDLRQIDLIAFYSDAREPDERQGWIAIAHDIAVRAIRPPLRSVEFFGFHLQLPRGFSVGTHLSSEDGHCEIRAIELASDAPGYAEKLADHVRGEAAVWLRWREDFQPVGELSLSMSRLLCRANSDAALDRLRAVIRSAS